MYRKGTQIAKVWKKKKLQYSILAFDFLPFLFMKKILFLLPLLLLASCTSTPSTVDPTQTYTSPIETSTYGAGKHTVQIFADFQCPACINFSRSLGPIFESYAASGKITLEFKQYPLTQIHKNAYRDALAVLCANDQKKYGAYKLALYALEEKKAGATVSDNDRIALAQSAGVADMTKFGECLKSDAKKAEVDADIALGDSLKVEGTPTVFLDGKKLDLATIFRDFEKGKEFLDRVVSQ